MAKLPADVLTREAQVSSKLPLRHLQFQPHANLTRAAVLFRQPQQPPCGTALHLQRIVLDDRRCRAQLFTQDLNDLKKRLRMRHESWQQVARVNREDLRRLKSDRIRRTSLAIQGGNLAVEISG